MSERERTAPPPAQALKTLLDNLHSLAVDLNVLLHSSRRANLPLPAFLPAVPVHQPMHTTVTTTTMMTTAPSTTSGSGRPESWILCTPDECVTQPNPFVPVLHSSVMQLCDRLRLDPETQLCVKSRPSLKQVAARLRACPPQDIVQAQTAYEYLSTLLFADSGNIALSSVPIKQLFDFKCVMVPTATASRPSDQTTDEKPPR